MPFIEDTRMQSVSSTCLERSKGLDGKGAHRLAGIEPNIPHTESISPSDKAFVNAFLKTKKILKPLLLAAVAKSDLQKADALSPHSIRYGREIGAILLIYVIAMAYAATSPIILPFTLLYFAASWIHWRYNILYVSERCYESGGRCWDMFFKCVVWTLFLFELFTGDPLSPSPSLPACSTLSFNLPM